MRFSSSSSSAVLSLVSLAIPAAGSAGVGYQFTKARTQGQVQLGLTFSNNGVLVPNLSTSDGCGLSMVACDDGCIPISGICCHDGQGHYCDIGYVCDSIGCCQAGKTCDGVVSGCTGTDVQCNDGCIPQGTVCCGTKYCDAGYTCNSDETCSPGGSGSGSGSGGSGGGGGGGGGNGCDTGEVPCGSGCMPSGNNCCGNTGFYCLAGTTCDSAGNCHSGGGSGSGGSGGSGSGGSGDSSTSTSTTSVVVKHTTTTSVVDNLPPPTITVDSTTSTTSEDDIFPTDTITSDTSSSSTTVTDILSLPEPTETSNPIPSSQSTSSSSGSNSSGSHVSAAGMGLVSFAVGLLALLPFIV